MKALQIAAFGMMVQQRATEVVAHNLANMNTTGYQRRRTEFTDLIYKVSERKGSVSSRPGKTVPGGVVSGQGVRMASVYRVSEQGSLASTSNSFDLAIQGKGYFQVLLPNGDTAFTRDGTERKGSVSSRPGKTVPGGVVSGQGVRMASVYRVSEQGSLASTSNSFDLAIQGKGYFQVLLPNGDTAFTRDGTFQLDDTGQMVTHDGFALEPGISIPAGTIDVIINASGEVLVTGGIGDKKQGRVL